LERTVQRKSGMDYLRFVWLIKKQGGNDGERVRDSPGEKEVTPVKGKRQEESGQKEGKTNRFLKNLEQAKNEDCVTKNKQQRFGSVAMGMGGEPGPINTGGG